MTGLFDLKGRTALITGSSRGIGRAIAERMAEAGARVVVSSRKLDACEEVVTAIKKAGGEATALACNISNKPELQQLVDRTRQVYGKIDILVCNAAVNPHYGTTQDIPDTAFQKVIDCN